MKATKLFLFFILYNGLLLSKNINEVNFDSLIYHEFIGKWVGTIGNKPLEIIVSKIENLSQELFNKNISDAYNIVAGKKRNLKGNIYAEKDVFYIKLSEPGDDKWDGIFEFKVDNDGEYNGIGTWKSNNGELIEKILLKKQKPTENINIDVVHKIDNKYKKLLGEWRGEAVYLNDTLKIWPLKISIDSIEDNGIIKASNRLGAKFHRVTGIIDITNGLLKIILNELPLSDNYSGDFYLSIKDDSIITGEFIMARNNPKLKFKVTLTKYIDKSAIIAAIEVKRNDSIHAVNIEKLTPLIDKTINCLLKNGGNFVSPTKTKAKFEFYNNNKCIYTGFDLNSQKVVSAYGTWQVTYPNEIYLSYYEYYSGGEKLLYFANHIVVKLSNCNKITSGIYEYINTKP